MFALSVFVADEVSITHCTFGVKRIIEKKLTISV